MCNDKSEPAGTKYRTYFSKTIQKECSYLIYLPPGYEQDKEKRYPVVYWLPGAEGDQIQVRHFLQHLEPAIKTKKAPQMVVVGVQALKESMYCDNLKEKVPDHVPMESIIIHDLIPHIDATYRTKPERAYRALEGFSMGGFGAARLGFKHPELFGVVSIVAGALYDEDEWPGLKRIFLITFGGDKEYCKANLPQTIVQKNAEAIKGRTRIRILVGRNDLTFPQCQRFHELLNRLKIEHEFTVIPDNNHDKQKFYADRKYATFDPFYQEAFK
jgi:endo-1,4-beta-xylanase